MNNDPAPSYSHTKALLGYLFNAYGRGKAGSSPPQPQSQLVGLSLLEISVRKLALAQSRAASAASSSTAPSDTSGTTDDEDDEKTYGGEEVSDAEKCVFHSPSALLSVC